MSDRQFIRAIDNFISQDVNQAIEQAIRHEQLMNERNHYSSIYQQAFARHMYLAVTPTQDIAAVSSEMQTLQSMMVYFNGMIANVDERIAANNSGN